MSSLREKVATQIKTDNPDFIVKAFPAPKPDNLGAGKVQVSVYRASLAPDQINMNHELEIAVFTGATVLSLESEDTLDAALDEVLLSIERINGVLWTNASREEDGYKVSVRVVSPNVYKNIVREEQKGL